MTARRLCLLALAGLALGCPSETLPPPFSPVPASTSDPLATRPSLGPPRPFRAPQAESFQLPGGTTVWLVSRPAIPVVSMSLAVPFGAADDPLGKGGLAHVTTGMLDEGAGERDAIEISTAIDDLGADLWSRTGYDGSRVSLSCLERHLAAAFPIFADVIARPRFTAEDWARVQELWLGRLDKRSDDANAVAGLVRRGVLYGPDTAYGHPASGYRDSAATIELDDVKAHYRATWRPDVAHLVVVGAITREQIEALWSEHLADWKAPDEPAREPITPPAPLSSRPRVVLVDRPEAPQAVFGVVAPGVPITDPRAPRLDLLNTALGGSFTSRLNQNLREDHGWTYGASSYFIEARGIGPFVARTAVPPEVLAAALREMRNEIQQLRREGLSEDELAKVKAQDLTDAIQTAETVDRLAGRLTSLAILGLPADHDAQISAQRQAATLGEVNQLAGTFFDASPHSIVVVGPATQLMPQLRALDLGTPERWTPEGRPAR